MPFNQKSGENTYSSIKDTIKESNKGRVTADGFLKETLKETLKDRSIKDSISNISFMMKDQTDVKENQSLISSNKKLSKSGKKTEKKDQHEILQEFIKQIRGSNKISYNEIY